VVVPRGRTVTLDATPLGEPNGFDGWSGGCSGMATSCQVTMDADKTVTATFVQMIPVTVNLDDGNGGTVPAGCCEVDISGAQTLACTDQQCQLLVKPGDQLTFAGVSRQPGWQPLNAWGGACTGVELGDCRLTITASTTVQKSFVQTG
jgi:List-Bact-rpt repeat protein